MTASLFESFLAGTWVSIQILVISTIGGLALALPVALARLSPFGPLRILGIAWSAFFRGTPLLVQLFLFYYGLRQFEIIHESFLWPVLKEAYPWALLAFTLNMSAYVAEVVRAGIAAIPRGEREAAESLGLSVFQTYRLVILPRAFRIMLPALANEIILQLKATALASAVPLTVLDLTGVAHRLYSKSYSTEPLFLAGAVYIALTFLLARFFRFLEQKLHIPAT
jgi:His/Glu/Gln/Arg/opine family amino acid ABC transporter permease subunit